MFMYLPWLALVVRKIAVAVHVPGLPGALDLAWPALIWLSQACKEKLACTRPKIGKTLQTSSMLDMLAR